MLPRSRAGILSNTPLPALGAPPELYWAHGTRPSERIQSQHSKQRLTTTEMKGNEKLTHVDASTSCRHLCALDQAQVWHASGLL